VASLGEEIRTARAEAADAGSSRCGHSLPGSLMTPGK
jgi:hypothetical protein